MAGLLVAVGAGIAIPAGHAATVIEPTQDPLALARAMAENPGFVTGAEFLARPPAGVPTAIAGGDAIAKFPTGDDGAFGIISTGDATLLPAGSEEPRFGVDAGGTSERGEGVRDATILRIDLRMPPDASCVALDVRFLTDEWDPRLLSITRPDDPLLYNDAFLVERSGSDGLGPNWKLPSGLDVVETSPELVFRPTPIQLLDGDFWPTEATGTSYAAASPILPVTIPVKGERSIYLSLFDEGDALGDTTVMLDDLGFGVWNDLGFCERRDTVVVRTSSDSSVVQPGGSIVYGLDLLGLTPVEAKLRVSALLPPSFTYVPDSTSGATVENPELTVEPTGQQRLTWSLAHTPPTPPTSPAPSLAAPTEAAPGVSLRFSATVAAEAAPGRYLVEAATEMSTGDGSQPFLLATGPSSPVEIPPPPPSADIEVTQTQVPSPVVLGSEVTYRLRVTNHGPSAATGVRVEFTPPGGITISSASASQGACTVPSGLRCELGTLASGATATITIVGLAERGASGGGQLSASAVEVDPVATNNAAALETNVVAEIVEPAPEPEFGKKVAAEPVSGTVEVTLPGETAPIPLVDAGELPTGTRIDASEGKVEITTEVTPAGGEQIATFGGAEFIVTQPAAQQGVTVLKLVGGDFDRCAQSRPGAGRSLQKFVKEHGKPVRGLWGEGKGKFRTRGKWGSATVRGTRWFTGDLCSGTLVKVRRGVVAVRSHGSKRVVLVRAGQSFLAPKPKRGPKAG